MEIKTWDGTIMNSLEEAISRLESKLIGSFTINDGTYEIEFTLVDGHIAISNSYKL